MGALIDRDALCAELQRRVGSPEGHRRLMEANQCICDAPAVDAAPVVRCVDCRRFFQNKRYAAGNVCFKCPPGREREFFCADGERMEARK